MIGEKIRYLRNKEKLTQKELADKLGLAQSTIGMIESGKREVSFEILIKIARFFDVSTDYLLVTESEKTIKESSSSYRIDGGSKIASNLPFIPKEFTDPSEARAYISKHQIFGFGGFNPDKMSDNEILEFANELLKQMELVAYKYKK